ncbi:dehydrogenases with different specificities (related to short-chain alcohol dehydrogenases)-like protein [Ramlibacter tataouinensis TTB310]|uniref:Dehydrogenases with different specificities (Related to short-chain alcohol dehydrogenases)-like protein n=2 Tax=Ramlibacter tataouinensis TaxID=94132 RepID=F5Y1N6_RAMTT|nr:dehydrogenases with different specificities (related to short-chain alcohol dehydrogenases)-like protein [Ramlibacter tataouinensis TTB310]
MARQLLRSGHELLCISRKPNGELTAQAAAAGLRCEQWPADLGRPDAVAARLETWLKERGARDEPASVTLINNAGVIPEIAPLEQIAYGQVADAMRVDLEAPMLLSGAFLRATTGWRCPRRLLNISSGLGRRAMASQAVYCAAKAGMDHFSRCVALEQAQQANGARVCSLAPGVIDTDMQVQLRSADASRFPDIGAFQGMKQQGALSTPDDAAARVLAFLARPDFGKEPVADVRG